MKEYIIVSDCHGFGTHQVHNFWAIIRFLEIKVEERDTDNIIILNDNIDRANMKKKDKKIADKWFFWMKDSFKWNLPANHDCYKVKDFGMDVDKYIDFFKRHGKLISNDIFKVIDGHILGDHGWGLLYTFKKRLKWMIRKATGKGIFRWAYNAYKKTTMFFINHDNPYVMSLENKERCYQLCKMHGCDVYLLGHVHKDMDIYYKGIRIVSVGMGLTIKEL